MTALSINPIKPINIVSAEAAGELKLRLGFDDGATQVVNFKPFLMQAQHPDIRAFLDPEKFTNFRIEHGDLVWGDYELCFPIIDLYRNTLSKDASLDAAA